MAFSLPSFSDIFSKTPQSVIGVDIGTSSIKVVQLRREKGQAILETYGAIALGPYANLEIGRATALPTEKIVEALKDVLREANVTTKDAGLSIPYSASLVSILKLPAAAEGHLAQAVPLEARKYIPVPISEVLLDWSLVGGQSSSDGKIEILLVAIHNETIEKYRRIAADSALAAAFFEIEVFSAVRASLEHGIAPIAVVDMGAATTKFYVVERGLIRESHIINRGAQDLTLAASRALNISVAAAEERKRKNGIISAHPGADTDLARTLELSLAPLMTELTRTIASYESRMNQTLSGLVMTGGGAALKGLGAYAQGKLQTEVRLADPFNKTKTPAFLAEILKEAGPEFSVAVGLALRRLQEV